MTSKTATHNTTMIVGVNVKVPGMFLLARLWLGSFRTVAMPQRHHQKEVNLTENTAVSLSKLQAPAERDRVRLVRLHFLLYIALQLRDAVSLFSRYKISEADVQVLKEKCRLYYNACALFLPRDPTPTVWIIGHVVPAHVEKLQKEIGFGLGIGTTQGREAKVQVAKKYLEHTVPANKYDLFFRHEYMHLIWLAKYDPQEDTYHRTRQSYLPSGVAEQSVCHCGHAKEEASSTCSFCKHPFRRFIEEAADAGRITDELKAVWAPLEDTLLSYE